MKIENIISKGEMLNAEQLAKITGGTGDQATNVNTIEKCSCVGEGTNVNTAKGCSCQPKINTDTPCKYIVVPGSINENGGQ